MNVPTSQMQLTRAADYAIRVMIHLATLPESGRALLPALAEATDAPESFLSKVLQALTRGKMISSRRGPLGGFEILPHGRQASILEVIEAIDSPIHLNVCLRNRKSCNRKVSCPAHPVWIKAQAAMLEVLSAAIVADLAASVVPAHVQQTPPLGILKGADMLCPAIEQREPIVTNQRSLAAITSGSVLKA
ncbi:MAG: Rrf2 family transcriptional regulator [Terracidiphilus sp.]